MYKHIGILLFCVIAACKATGNETCLRTYSCLDCDTARLCRSLRNGSFEEVLRTKCPSKAPYCNPTTGTCQKEVVDYSCAPVNTTVICQGDGFFPDPDVCKNYNVCHKGIAHPFECSSYYDPGSQSCTTSSSYSCYKPFKCNGKHAVKVENVLDSSYFAYCVNGLVKYVDKCPSKYLFDTDSQICVPSCSTKEAYADVDDSTKYFVCGNTESSSSSSYTLSHLSCAGGYYFDAAYLSCLPKRAGLASRTAYIKPNTFEIDAVVEHLKKHNRI